MVDGSAVWDWVGWSSEPGVGLSWIGRWRWCKLQLKMAPVGLESTPNHLKCIGNACNSGHLIEGNRSHSLPFPSGLWHWQLGK